MYLGNWPKTCCNSSYTCLLNHHFSPKLVHAHPKQWLYTSGLSFLYMTSYHWQTPTLSGVQKILFPTDDFLFLFSIKNIIPCSYSARFVPPNVLYTRYINLYLAFSLDSVESDPDLYRFLTFHVPNLMFLFHCVGRTKVSVQAEGTCTRFATRPSVRVRCS